MKKYITSPRASKNMPDGIPYIIGNELAERFSFYGMKCILVVFMTKYLVDSNGNSAPMSNEEATAWYHWFTSAVYFTPILGAIIADAFLGKYKTLAPSFFVFSTKASTSFNLFSVVKGPSIVSLSIPFPIFNLVTLSTNVLAKISFLVS